MRTIRSIGVFSAFKVGAVTYALLFAIFGGIFLVLQLVFGGLMATSGGQDAMGAAGMMAGVGIIGYLVGIVIYGILGGIGSAIGAFIYNIVASMIGGIEINLE